MTAPLRYLPSPDPADPADPAASADPADPAAPAGPARLASAAGPAAPVRPARPADPAAPAGPARPTGPANPATLAGPAAPAGPARPASPAGPAAPAGPARPAGPALRPLPEYEPSHAPDELPPRRWSSLRPAAGPQLRLVARPQEATITPEALWRLLVRVLEVLEGRRNVGQLRRLLSDVAYEALLTRLRCTTPGRTHRLRRIRACYPSATAAEVAAVVDIAAGGGEPRRVCAMAARLDRREDVWHCEVLRIL